MSEMKCEIDWEEKKFGFLLPFKYISSSLFWTHVCSVQLCCKYYKKDFHENIIMWGGKKFIFSRTKQMLISVDSRLLRSHVSCRQSGKKKKFDMEVYLDKNYSLITFFVSLRTYSWHKLIASWMKLKTFALQASFTHY